MARATGWILVAGLLPAVGCAEGEGVPGAVPRFPSTAVSTSGMVVTGSPYATEAGVRMLEAGGNAMDAAVAAAFALAVAEPTQSGLGGRTQLLHRTARGAVHAIDGGTEVPAVYDPERAPAGETGYPAVGIPGTVAALTRAHREHGALALEEVMAPAIAWAEGGVVLPDGEQARIRELLAEEGPDSPLEGIFEVGTLGVATSDSRGDAEGSGGSLVQPALARTLRAIAAEGHAGFYGGWVGAALAEDVQGGGGFVSGADLQRYAASDAPVGRTRVAGLDVVGSYLPASGVTVAQILGILDRVRLPEDEGGWAGMVAHALVAGFEDRETAEGMEPDAAIAWLTSDSLLERRAREVDAAAGDPLALAGADRGASTTVEASRPTNPASGGQAPWPSREPPFTSHISVTDASGDAVAMTQSLGPTGGARVVTPELGFLYASTLGGYLTAGGPGYRPWSSQAPVILVDGDELAIVAGGAGARRIISALVVTISRVLHRGASLEDAMAAPRLHPSGGRIYVEAGWGPGAALAESGHEVEERPRSYFARLNVIGFDGARAVGIAQAEWSGASAAGPR